MLVLRFFLVAALLGIGGSILLWIVTGNPRYRRFAWQSFQVALVVLFVILAMFALERVLVPLV